VLPSAASRVRDDDSRIPALLAPRRTNGVFQGRARDIEPRPQRSTILSPRRTRATHAAAVQLLSAPLTARRFHDTDGQRVAASTDVTTPETRTRWLQQFRRVMASTPDKDLHARAAGTSSHHTRPSAVTDTVARAASTSANSPPRSNTSSPTTWASRAGGVTAAKQTDDKGDAGLSHSHRSRLAWQALSLVGSHVNAMRDSPGPDQPMQAAG